MCSDCTPFATSPSVLDCLGTGVAAMRLATIPLSCFHLIRLYKGRDLLLDLQAVEIGLFAPELVSVLSKSLLLLYNYGRDSDGE
jgi:hypothetical protein